MSSYKYGLVLVDMKNNTQVVAKFNDLNAIDQVPPELVKQLKIYNEKKGKGKSIISVDEHIRRMMSGN